MSTITTSTTIDLGDLLAFRDEVAPMLDSLVERIGNDDETALGEANAILAREDLLVESVVDRFVEHAPEINRGRAADCLRDGITNLCLTGDLFAAVSDYDDRRTVESVNRHVSAFTEAIRGDSDAVAFADIIADEVTRFAAGLFRPVAS